MKLKTQVSPGRYAEPPCQAYLTNILVRSGMAAAHAGRETVLPVDMALVRRLSDVSDGDGLSIKRRRRFKQAE